MIRDCKKGPVCNFCGEEGHKSFDCPYAKEAKEKVKSKMNTGATESKQGAAGVSNDNKKLKPSLAV